MINTKTLRDISITALALGTAYGLGILSCVYFEVKAVAEVLAEVNKDSHHRYEES